MRITPFFLAIGLATALENGLARTPQLGWVCTASSELILQKRSKLTNAEHLEFICLQHE
jgi:hypothetical protein